MSGIEKRIAIAVSQKWSCCGKLNGEAYGYPPNVRPPTVKQLIDNNDPFPSVVPDYPADLNAMHEAEMSLPVWDDSPDTYRGTREHFRHQLCLICPQPIHATAAQRAEAFLKTISRLKD